MDMAAVELQKMNSRADLVKSESSSISEKVQSMVGDEIRRNSGNDECLVNGLNSHGSYGSKGSIETNDRMNLLKVQSNGLCQSQLGEKINNSGQHNSSIAVNENTKHWQSIHKSIEESISEHSSQKIDTLLHEISKLSDLEKLLLYIKLPTGFPDAPDPLKINVNYPLGNRPHVTQAFTWIRTHLDEDSEISLPKHEVYDSYRIFCQLHEIRSLSTADFGKAIKQVFPSVKPRRLGTRGNSRYCYSGLCKKKTIASPSLPDITELINDDVFEKDYSKSASSSTYDDVLASSTQLICEWAEKLLNQSFDSLSKLAYYLVSNMLVDKRSVAAFTLLFLIAKNDSEASQQATLLLNDGGGNHHKETQLQLQRKIQEKERIKEQKRKMNEHQSACNKPPSEKVRSKKSVIHKVGNIKSHLDSKTNHADERRKPKNVAHLLNSAGNVSAKDLTEDNSFNTDPKANETRLSPNQAPTSSSLAQEGANADTKMTNIILVPSIPTLSFSQYQKCKSKYKPIQPKPNKTDGHSQIADDADSYVALGQTHQTPILSSEEIDLARANDCGIHTNLKRSVEHANSEEKNKKAHMENECADDPPDVDFTCFNRKVGGVENGEPNSTQNNNTEQISQLRWLLQQNYDKDLKRKTNQNNYEQKTTAKGFVHHLKSDVLENNNTTKNCSDNFENCVSVSANANQEVQTTLDKPFQFMPIPSKLGGTQDSLIMSNQSSQTGSPVPNSAPAQQVSSNVFGPQFPESPFVSPRATPLSRSRHNSGQTRSSVSQVTVESSTNSPFLSPHGTPVHVRSRHGSGVQNSSRFGPMGLNNRPVCTLPSVREMLNQTNQENVYSRTRNFSGNIISHVSPLSPLSKSAPMSPMYSQFSSSQPDLSHGWTFNTPVISQQMPRQVSLEPSPEIDPPMENAANSNSSRCQSVPLYQMLQNMNQSILQNDPRQDVSVSKSYPATPNENQVFHFPSTSDTLYHEPSNMDVSYPATPATTPVHLSYPSTPAYPGGALTDGYNSNMTMLDSTEDNLLQCSGQNANSYALIYDDLQAMLENLKNSDLSQLERELEQNL